MCTLKRFEEWLARKLLMGCRSSATGPLLPFPACIMGISHRRSAQCPPIHPRAWGLMLVTSSIKVKVLTTLILLLWNPASFLAHVRPDVVICMVLTV